MTDIIFDHLDIRKRMKGDDKMQPKPEPVTSGKYFCLTCEDKGYLPSPLRPGKWRNCHVCANPHGKDAPFYPAPTT